jgi:hypothetical protein
MSISAVTGAQATYWLSTRPGPVENGTPYLALVSDLVDGDYLCGPRTTVVTAGSTTSGNRTLTLSRVGFQWTTTMPAASQVMIIRA